MRYPAPGAVGVARRVVDLLRTSGMAEADTATRGLDHGAWIPLRLMFPDADIPVTQLSVQPHAGPRRHLEVGRALSALRDEGVLVIGSGALTHDLAAFRSDDLDAAATPWVTDFAEWIAERVALADTQALLDYRERAPFAVRNHPTEEHLLPLFVALGAGGEAARGIRIHSSQTHGALSMDAYAFAEEF
jgi:4,5-DOPA dioxygenase extradiol